MVFKLRDDVFMFPLFTHLISSYMRFSDCILHRFELRYEVLISFNLFLSFNHGTLKIINRQVFLRKE
jgi:hypothetical protein